MRELSELLVNGGHAVGAPTVTQVGRHVSLTPFIVSTSIPSIAPPCATSTANATLNSTTVTTSFDAAGSSTTSIPDIINDDIIDASESHDPGSSAMESPALGDLGEGVPGVESKLEDEALVFADLVSRLFAVAYCISGAFNSLWVDDSYSSRRSYLEALMDGVDDYECPPLSYVSNWDCIGSDDDVLEQHPPTIFHPVDPRPAPSSSAFRVPVPSSFAFIIGMFRASSRCQALPTVPPGVGVLLVTMLTGVGAPFGRRIRRRQRLPPALFPFGTGHP